MYGWSDRNAGVVGESRRQYGLYGLSWDVNGAGLFAYNENPAGCAARLKGRVEVIELVPPAVQTGLTPGQSTRPGYQPLDQFADEVMQLLTQQPTPPEILVERVHFLRNAEAEGRFDSTLAQLNEMARRARGAG